MFTALHILLLLPSVLVIEPKKMASAASRMGQAFRESVGLASTTVDPDVVKALENLKVLEADVILLRKVMETANKILNRTLPDARSQAVQLMAAMSAKLIIRPDEVEAYSALKDTHEVLDVTLPKKFGDVECWTSPQSRSCQ